MFKKRISQWQLDKKRKRKEMVYAVKQIRGRQALGKATVVFIRNEEVSQWDITRYFKRRPLTASEQHQRLDGSPAPSDVIAKTPVLQACTPAAVRIAPQFSHPNAITEDKTTDVEREVYSAQAMALQDEKARHLSVPDAFLAYHEQPVPQCFAYQLEPHEEFLGWFYCYDECSFGKSSRWEDLIWALWWDTRFRAIRHYLRVPRYHSIFPTTRRHVRVWQHPSKRHVTQIPRGIMLLEWHLTAAIIAWWVEATADGTERDYMLSRLYYLITEHLDPCHPAVYMLSSAARATCTSGEVRLTEALRGRCSGSSNLTGRHVRSSAFTDFLETLSLLIELRPQGLDDMIRAASEQPAYARVRRAWRVDDDYRPCPQLARIYPLQRSLNGRLRRTKLSDASNHLPWYMELVI